MRGLLSGGRLWYDDRMAQSDRTGKRRKRLAQARTDAPSESSGVEFVTVGWTLSVLTTLGCEVLAMVTALAGRAIPSLQMLLLFSDLLLFAAVVVGAISLMLLAIVWRGRVEPIPGLLVVASLLIAALAPLLIWIRAVR